MENQQYNKFQKIINILQKYGLIITSVIIGLIGIISIFVTAYFPKDVYLNVETFEETYYKFSLGIFEIIFTIIGAILIAFLSKKVFKKINSKILIIGLLLIDIIIYVFWINILKIRPYGDQQSVQHIAIQLLDGNIEQFFKMPAYLFLFPYQLGITLFIAIIYKIFGENFMYLQYANVVFTIINMWLIFYITKLIFKKENIQKILVILLVGFSLYWMFFNTFIYGNIVGLTFALIAVLFTIRYLEKRKIYNLIISGIAISVSIILKSNYNIFLCGIILVIILDIIKRWKIKTLAIIPVFLIGYLIISLGYSALVKYKLKIDLPEGTPMSTYIYMGMAEPKNSAPRLVYRRCNKFI